MYKLKIENLTAYYTNKKIKTKALDNFSLNLKQGELLVILGPSGCGKTTLLKCITGTLDYDEGYIEISGIDAQRLSIKDRNLAYVSQSFYTYGFMSVYNNIALPLKAQKVPLEEIEQRVLEISKKLEIDYLLSRRPKQLSGGQQQKVALARALIKNPDIYLFDEPLSNLDPLVKVELKKEIKKIKEEYNATMIFVTHDINDALYLADRVIIMDQGKIVEEGNIHEIIKNPSNDFVKKFLLLKENENE
mgnify:CR=1 FL=1